MSKIASAISGASDMTEASRIRRFKRRLLAWYDKHQRDLPWRRTQDPYKILVSEIMLQQTQVDRVIPKYHEFLKKYPTLQTLARTRPQSVRKTWYPLGYNIRPLRLRNIAREAIAKYDGKLPDTVDGLMSMDGIGRYTAGAIMSFAYRKDAPILDTNVERLLRRLFGVNGDTRKAAARKRLWRLAEDVIPRGKAYIFNQALMDYGAMVCTARKPACSTCRLRSICASYPVNGHTAKSV